MKFTLLDNCIFQHIHKVLPLKEPKQILPLNPLSSDGKAQKTEKLSENGIGGGGGGGGGGGILK